MYTSIIRTGGNEFMAIEDGHSSRVRSQDWWEGWMKNANNA